MQAPWSGWKLVLRAVRSHHGTQICDSEGSCPRPLQKRPGSKPEAGRLVRGWSGGSGRQAAGCSPEMFGGSLHSAWWRASHRAVGAGGAEASSGERWTAGALTCTTPGTRRYLGAGCFRHAQPAPPGGSPRSSRVGAGSNRDLGPRSTPQCPRAAWATAH